MTVLDLFSGIGGFSLGLERAGMTTVAFCEIDPFCRRVLAKHWPKVPCYYDVKTLTANKIIADGIAVDLICGGFPCQDISIAGKGAGIDGARSGLWSEYARIISEVRPRYVIVENVSALRSRGLARVLGDLASLGFDAEWHCIPASAVGAPHQRDRVWIVAYSQSYLRQTSGDEIADTFNRTSADVADAASTRWQSSWSAISGEANGWRSFGQPCRASEVPNSWWLSFERHGSNIRSISKSDWWLTEPHVGRVAHGVPARVDRLRSLGNAVVPQITEIIGRVIIEAERDR